MAFSSTGLTLLLSGGLNGNAPNLWHYRVGAGETSTNPFAVGYFAGVGKGSKGSGGMGMKVNDLVVVSESTLATNPGRTQVGTVYASTVNQASTTGSTGFSAAYDCTIRGTT